MTKNILPVSEATAKLFMTQCVGTYSGHMANIAFSPTIQAIAECHGLDVHIGMGDKEKERFAHFLRDVANQLFLENNGGQERAKRVNSG